jgi:hypothetical protein
MTLWNLASRPQLEKWRDFLSEQIDRIVSTGAVHQLCNDPDIFVESIVADAQLQQETIDRAIEEFIVTGEWPDWRAQSHAEQLAFLLHRMVVAHISVIRILADEALLRQVLSEAELDDRAWTIRWLLIITWNIGGAEYLENYARKFLKKNPPSGWARPT